MATRVYLSNLGRPVAPEAATVSVFDRGFLYGDSVYETLRTAGGRPVALAEHLQRLGRSAAGIMLDIPFSDEAIITAIRETLADADNPDSKVRVVVTRGGGAMALDTRRSRSPLLVIYVTALELPSAADYARGLSAVIVEYRGHNRDMFAPSLKTGNYLPSILALRAAIEREGEDAIMVNARGHVTEGAASNVFMVRGDAVITPDLGSGVLPGITRQTVLDLARAQGMSVVERAVEVAELRAADEVFFTSSVRGIMPVTTLDGVPVGPPVPGTARGPMGPVTRTLWDAYEGWMAKIARGAVGVTGW